MAADPNRIDESDCQQGQQKIGQSEIDERLDRLYVPVKTPNGTDELLRFQWMRPHPATLMACLPDDEDEQDEIPSSVKQLSRAFPSYQASLRSYSDDPLGAAIQEKKQYQSAKYVQEKKQEKKQYQSAEYESGGGDEQRNHQVENMFPQHESLLQATGVKVDLCDYLLLEPPLLSPVTEKIVQSMQSTGNSEI